MGSNNRRIVLYSHDTQGLGHMRRNLSIATALRQADPNSSILLVTGAREVNAFPIPSGVDCLTLPALGKDDQGQYRPRSLTISRQRLVALRANIIRATVEAFAPDVFIADKVPLGIFGELEPSLTWLSTRSQTRCILGLREILDDPETVRREWRLAGNDAALRAYYDTIWIYGDPQVYDPVAEYGFANEVAAKVQYTGYLDRKSLYTETQSDTYDLLTSRDFLSNPLALCLVGGGQDGERLVEAFLRADLPAQTNGLVVTGPFMPANVCQRLQDLSATRPHHAVLPFVTEPEALLQRADHIITMGGYNTTCEVLSFQKRALIVPRVKPRREQLIRAERLASLGLVDYLHPAQLTPEALTAWLASENAPSKRSHNCIDLNGLTRLPNLLEESLAAPPRRSRSGKSYQPRASYNFDQHLTWPNPANTILHHQKETNYAIY